MKTALLAFALLFSLTATAQRQPTKFCSSGDNSLECVSRRNQENVDRYIREQKEKSEKEMARIREEREERERLKTIKEKDCNPRVRNCN